MPEINVNANVAYKNSFSMTATDGEAITCAKTTKNTAPIWQTVLILPNMLGRKSRNPTVADRATAVARMHTSRLSTRTVYFHGIFLAMDSTKNSELSRSLSAIGSR